MGSMRERVWGECLIGECDDGGVPDGGCPILKTALSFLGWETTLTVLDPHNKGVVHFFTFHSSLFTRSLFSGDLTHIRAEFPPIQGAIK